MSDLNFTDHHVVHQNCEEAADLIEQQAAEMESQNHEILALKAHVERLIKACELARDNYGKMLMTDPPQEAWKVNQVTARLVEAIAATPQQNLNAVKRDAYKDGFIDGYRLLLESANGIAIHNYCGMAEKYANTKYPSGKE